MGEYENCTFLQCDFSNADLSNFNFGDCNFVSCNFSNVKLFSTTFREAHFADCKLLGMPFHKCNPFLFSVNFENCNLNVSVFYQLKMKNTRFVNCTLRDTDFSEADLTQAVFDRCDMAGAIFGSTLLEKADFRTAIHYSLDPEQNRMKKAKFSQTGLMGLLLKYNLDIS